MNLGDTEILGWKHEINDAFTHIRVLAFYTQIQTRMEFHYTLLKRWNFRLPCYRICI